MAKILIVDADQAAAKNLKRVLELEGYDVVTATTIAAGRNKSGRFNLEIWEGTFADRTIDGALEAMGRFNDDKKNVLLYTASEDALRLAASYEAPRLTKPTEDAAIRTVVRQLLAGGQQHET